MAHQNVCRYNKFGFCKFQEVCRKKHVNEKCNSSSCEITLCELRHPKICRYFRDHRRCKFGEYCYFEHKENEHGVFEQKLNEMKTKIDKLEKKVIEKDDIIKNLVEKVENFEIVEKIENIEKMIKEKDILIQDLVEKIKIWKVNLILNM